MFPSKLLKLKTQMKFQRGLHVYHKQKNEFIVRQLFEPTEFLVRKVKGNGLIDFFLLLFVLFDSLHFKFDVSILFWIIIDLHVLMFSYFIFI